MVLSSVLCQRKAHLIAYRRTLRVRLYAIRCSGWLEDFVPFFERPLRYPSRPEERFSLRVLRFSGCFQRPTDGPRPRVNPRPAEGLSPRSVCFLLFIIWSSNVWIRRGNKPSPASVRIFRPARLPQPVRYAYSPTYASERWRKRVVISCWMLGSREVKRAEKPPTRTIRFG